MIENPFVLVCGTDLSEGSLAAEEAGAAISARRGGTELWLVHVLGSLVGSPEASIVESIKAEAEKQLAKRTLALRERFGVDVRACVLGRDAARRESTEDALMRFSSEKRAGALLMSSKGHSGSPLRRVGGITERVAESARLPVIVVRDAAPFVAWGQENRPLRVLLAVDGTMSSEAAIVWVKELCAAGPCDIAVTQVYYADEAAKRYGIRHGVSLVEPNPDIERWMTQDLERQFGEHPGTGSLKFRPYLGLGRIGDHVLEVADVEACDLIVVGTHHRHGLGRLASVASVVLHFGHASVASIPSSEDRGEPQEIPVFQRVLAATDLSDSGNAAIRYAYALCGERGGEVHIVHVLPPKSRKPSEKVEIAGRLRALVPKAAGLTNVVTRPEVIRSEHVAEAICVAAERIGADVICLSSHSRPGVLQKVLGSVAEDVTRKSRRPVFIVRPLRE